MGSPSDPSLRQHISATEASRSFSELLDQVAAGRHFVICRHGEEVGELSPLRVDSRAASECLELLRGRPGVLLDDEFGRDLSELLESEALRDPRAGDS